QHRPAATGLGVPPPAAGRRTPRARVQALASPRPVLTQPRNKRPRGHAVHTSRSRTGPDTPQRPAQILRREHPLPQAFLQARDDGILDVRRPAATLSCGAQQNSPSPSRRWPASAGWLRSPRPARATPIPPPHSTFGPSRPIPPPDLRPVSPHLAMRAAGAATTTAQPPPTQTPPDKNDQFPPTPAAST